MKYSLESNIERDIIEGLSNFTAENGQQPDYIILGSQEYFELVGILTEMSGFKHFGPVWADNFRGLDIILSTGSGLQFGFKDNKKWSTRFETKKHLDKLKPKDAPKSRVLSAKAEDERE